MPRMAKPGRAGGLALVAKYGRSHMVKIGSKGGRRFWERYTYQPVGLTNFAIVSRTTGKIVNYTTSEFAQHVERNRRKEVA